MIKHIFALLLILLLIGISFADDKVINKTFDTVLSKTSEIALELDANQTVTENAKAKIDDLHNYYEKRQNVMSVFIHNEETKFLADSIHLLKAHADEDMFDETVVQTKTIEHEVGMLRRQYKTTITNVM